MPAPGMICFQVTASESGQRLDAVVAARLGTFSRSYLSSLIRCGHIQVEDAVSKPGHRVKAGQQVRVELPAPEPPKVQAEPLALDVLFEDRDLIIINKAPGLVVHPAPGHASGTLVNALLYHCPQLEGIGGVQRPGIVHRLDKDTSGVMAVAKTPLAHQRLAAQFKARQVQKTYLALVWGQPQTNSGRICLPIGRHPTDRVRMSSHSRRGRSAETLWRITQRLGDVTLLEVQLKTGRTHQIRVHCAAIGHPVLGDPVYGRARVAHRDAALRALTARIKRQMLHAWRLGFVHPRRLTPLKMEAPLPSDMSQLLEQLQRLVKQP